MVETTDKDRSQKILGYREKNFWYFNNYACLDLIRDNRFECGNIYSPIFTKELTNIVDEYSKVSSDLIRGHTDTNNEFYRAGKYVFPSEWEHNRYTLDVLFFYVEDLQFLEGSNNRGFVTIKPYIEGQKSSNGMPYFHPNLERVAMNKIEDLHRVRKLRKGIGKEFDKNCITNFFDFHLTKYNGSPTEFIKYSMAFMLKFCLQDTYDNAILMKEFRGWADDKFNEFDLRLNSFPTKFDEAPSEESEPKVKPQPLTFEGLFPSVEDMNMVMNLLQGLKIINAEGKYLLGSRTDIIRVFIDVMKEEGCFVDIERKKILRVFTPKILGRLVETIKKPINLETQKRQILKKYNELRK